MSLIRVLETPVANMIAAGEVVERPASVVKELLENAVDAGATAVTAEIRNGGVSFIRVADNGCGMSAEDAKMAFLRHATSKIRSAEDLAGIATMGFRGEALAAIASVSRIDLLTRQLGASLGTSLSLVAGDTTDVREAGCPEGTTIIVRDLFFNTPARRKFLKRDVTEAGHVQDAVLRAALGRPDISFRLLKDGSEILHTPGDGRLNSAVYSLFGSAFGQSLLDCTHTLGTLTVSGFVGKPETARGSRSMQYFFVRGRPVRCRTLYAALEEGFKNAIPAGRMPVCVLQLTLPPEEFDINVHPAKSEIKFLNDRQVFDAVYYAVRQALRSVEAHADLRLPAAPHGGLRVEMVAAEQYGLPQSSAQTEHSAGTPARSIEYLPSRDIFSSPTASSPSPALGFGSSYELGSIPHTCAPDTDASPLADYRNRLENTSYIAPMPSFDSMTGLGAIPDNAPDADTAIGTDAASAAQTPPFPAPAPMPSEPEWRLIGQALGGYLLVESAEALWMIDKHAAHERILFERLKAAEGAPMIQMLLSPRTVALPARLNDVLLREETLLARAGFAIENFGNLILLRGVPDFLSPEDAPALLTEIAEGLLSGGPLPTLREDALRTVACKAAVKLSEKGSLEDLAALTALVMGTPELRHCPHGRPVAIRLTRSQLERQFLR